jgi:hypothetical protein
MGDFGTDGKLVVTTFKKGDGLIPGKYRIGVECWEIPPQALPSPPPKSYVPDRYASPASSGLSVTVEPGQRLVKLTLDIPKK